MKPKQQVTFPLATDGQGNTFKAQGFAVLLGDPHNDEGDQLGMALYKREDLAWAAAQAHLQVDVLADPSVSGQRCDAHTHAHTHACFSLDAHHRYVTLCEGERAVRLTAVCGGGRGSWSWCGSVLFMPAQEMPFEDLDELEQYGWTVPSDTVFPLFAKVKQITSL